MDPNKWQQIQGIFSRVADLPENQQQSAVEELCAGDQTLVTETMAMLLEDRRANPLLDSNAAQTAQAMLDMGILPSLIQKQIGPYHLLELLGEGGMGVVYLAERTDIGGRVAIKLLRDAWLSPMRRQRFHLEQLTLAQLNHPAIARIYDSNTLEDGTPWFVMEYADGLPLTEYWKKRDGPIRDCLLLFRRVCEAVQYAHSYAIIHRDLKPSNILVTPQGEVKLLDFGIAKQLDAEETANSRTITGLRLMTPDYAAPEQIAGSAVGVYTDVYALGVLLYELLTTQLPFRREPFSTNGTLADHNATEREPAKPSALIRREQPGKRGELSRSEWADLDVLSLKALAIDPQQRYGTVDALIRDLDALLHGRPLEARPNRLRYTVSKFVRRNRRTMTIAAVMLILLAATVIFYTVRLTRARNAALQEAARTQRIQQFTESLFDGGDKSAGPALDLKVVNLLDRGRLEAASLAGDPEMQADMQETLGDIYQKLGKTDMADQLLTAALEKRRRILGGRNAKVADSLVSLGLLRKDQGKLDEAESLVRQGMEIAPNSASTYGSHTTRSMVALGSILEVRGKYDQAAEILDAALKLQPQSLQATVETSETISELANVRFYQGRYDQSETLNRQALTIDRRLFGEEHPAIAQSLNNLGAIEMNRGNYSGAETYYRQSLKITQAWYGMDHLETSANLTALAQPLTYLKRDAEAQVLLEQALAIQRRVNGPMTSGAATTLNQLGALAEDRDQYAPARDYFTQAMVIWKQLYGDQHQFVAVAYSNLGSVCLDEKDYSCAEKMFREAVHRLDTASVDNLNAAVAHLKLGRALLRQGRYGDAEPQTLSAYKYLVKQMVPSNGYLIASRKDLAAIYDRLNDPEKAAHYRTELSPPAAANH